MTGEGLTGAERGQLAAVVAEHTRGRDGRCFCGKFRTSIGAPGLWYHQQAEHIVAEMEATVEALIASRVAAALEGVARVLGETSCTGCFSADHHCGSEACAMRERFRGAVAEALGGPYKPVEPPQSAEPPARDQLVPTEGAAGASGGDSEVRRFVEWVASNAAYNGAPDDLGQRFYDYGLNPWLWEQAVEWSRAWDNAPEDAAIDCRVGGCRHGNPGSLACECPPAAHATPTTRPTTQPTTGGRDG